MVLKPLISALLLAGGALGGSPTDSYAPGNVSCPKVDSLVRIADSLNSDEADWVAERRKKTLPELKEFLKRANMTDFDMNSFFSNSSNPVNIALAFSGGGYRAMLSGAGMLAGTDKRTTNATNAGHLGGLLQSSTYLVGLSGGNWLVGSVVLNNFTSVQSLQGSKDIWDLEHSLVAPGGINIFKDASYWDGLKDDINAKQDAGYNTSITDIWGRGLSQQFIDLHDGGPALTWDDLRNYDSFKSHEMPFPIVVADGREPGTVIIASNSTVYEVTPYELGSWDPSLYAFADVKYLGTVMSDGKPVDSDVCVNGFDNAGFIMGTSSSLFNQFILQLNSTGVEGVVYDMAHSILNDLGSDYDDIAIYAPNPFKNVTYGNSTVSKAEWLTLVDGGEDNQNIPLYPLLQPERDVDVIFAFDNSADTDYSWPNGSSMVWSYQRQFTHASNETTFPYVPDTNTFINLNLTEHPTFFGCHASNLSSLFPDDLPQELRHTPPLIVYVPNYPHNYYSNTSTFKLSYDADEVEGMITNGYNIMTRQNSTLDSEWPACVGCAIIQRELERRNQSQTAQCRRCFEKYCWDGSIDNGAVNKTGDEYDPDRLIAGASAPLPTLATAIVVALMVAFSF
uniref:Lysophospholipase n=1 Tax=Blastobotrys adeninivorans TaxID=409370 RepID=A0A060TBV8_BLAAD